MRDRVEVTLGRAGGHGVVSEDLLEATFMGVACRTLDAEFSGNSAKNDGCEAATAKLKFEIRAVEGAPLTFENRDIAWLMIEFGKKFAPVRRQIASSAHGLVRGDVESIMAPGRKVDVDENRLNAGLARDIEQFDAIRDGVVRGMRSAFEARDAFLQINDDEGGAVWFESEFVHGS